MNRPRLAAAAGALAMMCAAGCGSTVQGVSGQAGVVTQDGQLVPSPGSSAAADGGLTVPGTTSGPGTTNAVGGTAPAGVTSTGAGTTSGTTATGAGTATTRGGTGATVAAGPVGPGITPSKIFFGIQYSTDAAAGDRALGAAGAAPSYDLRNVVNAVVKYANGHGGFAGRQLEPIFYNYSVSQDQNTQDQSACAHWTQDNKVFAIALADDVLRACAERAGAVALVGCDGTADTFKRFPHFVDPYCMRLDRLGSVTVKGLARAHYFSGTFGFVTWDDPKYRLAYQQGYVPALRAAGVSVKDTAFIGVPQQIGAISDMTAAVSSAITKFRSEGIDHVIIQDGPAGVFSGTGLTFEWMNQAESQGYRPRYGENALNSPGWSALPANQQDKALAIMDSDHDAKYDQGWHQNQTRQKCFKIQADAGYPVRSSNDNDEGIAAQVCDIVFFLQDVINHSQTLTNDGFVQTVEGLGRSFPSAFVYGTQFAPGLRDGSAEVRQAEYFKSCQCLKYSGAPYYP